MANRTIRNISAFLVTGLLTAFEAHAHTDKGPEFEVASIKLEKSPSPGIMFGIRPGGRFSANGITVKFLLEQAYDVKDSQISGAPSWTDSDRYDIDAKPDEATALALDKLPQEQRREQLNKMLQRLLADRFKLALSRDTKDLPIYALIVTKSGPKFQESTYKPPENPGNAPPPPPGAGGPMRQGIRMDGRGQLTITYVDMNMFADMLSRFVGRPVANKTGLTGKYDFALKWTPEEGQGPMPPGPRPGGDAGPLPPDASGPSIFTALQEQLGLKLEPQRAPMGVLVIEHVERPSEN
jgi:uncharacterized protein (TIGR03435 family)